MPTQSVTEQLQSLYQLEESQYKAKQYKDAAATRLKINALLKSSGVRLY